MFFFLSILRFRWVIFESNIFKENHQFDSKKMLILTQELKLKNVFKRNHV